VVRRTEPDAENEAARREPRERDGLECHLLWTPARERDDQRAEHDPLGSRRDRGERNPWVDERRGLHREVIPEEEAVPPGRLGPRAQLGHEPRGTGTAEGRRVKAVPHSQEHALLLSGHGGYFWIVDHRAVVPS